MPPGEVTSRLHRQRVVVPGLEQRGRPGHRLGHEPAGQRRREPVADGRVDLGLDDQRLVRGADTHHRVGGVHQPLGDLDHVAESPEQRQHVALLGPRPTSAPGE